MCTNLKFFATVMVLHIFLSQINITAPYPATSRKNQKFQAGDINATNHDAKHEVANTSSLQLLYEHAHDRRARQASGCLISTTVQHCGNHQIATVTCRQESVTCIGPGVVSPTCVTQKTYYQACGKAFDTACLCKS